MRWSRPRHQMAIKLREIERASKAAAEARLADARSEAGEAREACNEAQTALDTAEQGWRDHLALGPFDLMLSQALAAKLAVEHRQLEMRAELLEGAEQRLEWELEGWRMVEAKMRAGENMLRRSRRALNRRSEALADQALAERTTWRWFRR